MCQRSVVARILGIFRVTDAERRARRLLYRRLPSWRNRLDYRLFGIVLVVTKIGDFEIYRPSVNPSCPRIRWRTKGLVEHVGCVICGGYDLPPTDHVLNLMIRIQADPREFVGSINWPK